jgi:hypothetical protein
MLLLPLLLSLLPLLLLLAGFERVVPGGTAQLHSPGANTWKFPLPAAAHLPPTVLISSCTDVTVPWWVGCGWVWVIHAVPLFPWPGIACVPSPLQPLAAAACRSMP